MHEHPIRRPKGDPWTIARDAFSPTNQPYIDDRRLRTLADLSSLFRGIAPSDCTRLAASARLKRFERGEVLHAEGEIVQRVHLLNKGVAKITQLGTQGSEVILKLAIPGELLGAVSLFSNGRYCTTTQAFRQCEAFVWEAQVFRGFVNNLPPLKRNILRILVQYLEELEERFREVSTERVAPRVARQVARLADRIGQSVNDTIEIALSREELAQMTGTTLFTVSRLISAWEARGFVKARREAVAIRDLASLQAVADE